MPIIPPDTQQRDWEPVFEEIMPKNSSEPIVYGQFCAVRNLIKSIEDQAYARGMADMKKLAKENIDKYWMFTNDQQPISNWHDKQDLLTNLNNI